MSYLVYEYDSYTFVQDNAGNRVEYATMQEAEDVADHMQSTQSGLWLAIEFVK